MDSVGEPNNGRRLSGRAIVLVDLYQVIETGPPRQLCLARPSA